MCVQAVGRALQLTTRKMKTMPPPMKMTMRPQASAYTTTSGTLGSRTRSACFSLVVPRLVPKETNRY